MYLSVFVSSHAPLNIVLWRRFGILSLTVIVKLLKFDWDRLGTMVAVV